MDFLIGSPFSTAVGQRVESATSSVLMSEDWGINMEICDIINETEDGPKDAVRAIKKRILGNRNFKEVMFSLTVLETCVKNCGHRFHVLVSTKEFVEGVLVRTILPQNEPPQVISERVLGIIQAWADAFRSSPDLTGVVYVYENLRRKGVAFPMTELYSPIHTPTKRMHGSVRQMPLSPTHQAQSPEQMPPIPKMEDHDQVRNMKTELDVAHGNLRVMSDIMNQMDPENIKQADTELLKQLYSACKGTQDRMMQLIPRLSEEKLIDQLLVTNDDMNTTFTRYSSFKTFLNKKRAQQMNPAVDLIDFNPVSERQNQFKHAPGLSQAVSSLSSQMSQLSTSVEEGPQRKPSKYFQERNKQDDSVLDELAAGSSQLQNTELDNSPDSTPLGSSPQFYWMVEKGMIPVNQSDVMDNIEQWLDVEDDKDLEDEGETTEEFDRFLAGRVKAAERLPSVKESSTDHTPSKP